MKINKVLVGVLLVIVFALAVLSQIADEETSPNKIQQINEIKISDKLTLEEKQDCAVAYYNETIQHWGYVTRYSNINATCFNETTQSYYPCINGTEPYQSYEFITTLQIPKNTTECITKSYVVTIGNGIFAKSKELDFMEWGACIRDEENGCVAITCVAYNDGAHNGKFTDCRGGKTCQKFLFCEDGIKTLYKNSRADFTEYDPSFYLPQLALTEVEE